MGKFGSAATVNDMFRVEIIDPTTDLPLVDTAGSPAFVEVVSTDSDPGREFDKVRRKQGMQRAMRTRNSALAQDDPLEENQEKLSKLTRAWHLVDIVTHEPIDVACNEANALELYRDGGMQWLFRQVWVGASEAANFIRKPSKPLSNSPAGTSGSSESGKTAPQNATT